MGGWAGGWDMRSSFVVLTTFPWTSLKQLDVTMQILEKCSLPSYGGGGGRFLDGLWMQKCPMALPNQYRHATGAHVVLLNIFFKATLLRNVPFTFRTADHFGGSLASIRRGSIFYIISPRWSIFYIISPRPSDSLKTGCEAAIELQGLAGSDERYHWIDYFVVFAQYDCNELILNPAISYIQLWSRFDSCFIAFKEINCPNQFVRVTVFKRSERKDKLLYLAVRFFWKQNCTNKTFNCIVLNYFKGVLTLRYRVC